LRQAHRQLPRQLPLLVHARIELPDQPAEPRQLHRRANQGMPGGERRRLREGQDRGLHSRQDHAVRARQDRRLGRRVPRRRQARGRLGLLRTRRPRQWVKNVFVGAPLVFARHFTDPAYFVRSALAVIAFCALSGAVYAFNDVRDVEADRAHPTKCNRPIAAGALSERTALIAAGVLAAVALATCAVLTPWLALIAAGYAAQNVAYSV